MARLLVVDDDPDMRTLMKLQLEREGHRVTLAQDPKEAVAELKHHTFDAMLLDVDMPEMDGITFSRVLQENPRFLAYADMPVVMVTGQTEPGVMADSFDAGAVYFLRKPFEPQELLHIVRLVLQTTT